MNIDEFICRMSEIKKRGFIKSMRKGPTGVGKTLETLLDLYENNFSLPDLGITELKATRLNTHNLITLFTFNKKAWKMNPIEAIHKYGTIDKDPNKNGRLGLYYTLTMKPNSAGLFLYISEEVLSIRHIDGSVVASWNLYDIKAQFLTKLPSLILVYADSEEIKGVEYFHFNRAIILKNTSSTAIANALQNGDILIDLRLHDKGTSARNHGTGFRIKEANLEKLFSDIKELKF